jgi:hypothetical protein
MVAFLSESQDTLSKTLKNNNSQIKMIIITGKLRLRNIVSGTPPQILPQYLNITLKGYKVTNVDNKLYNIYKCSSLFPSKENIA